MFLFLPISFKCQIAVLHFFIMCWNTCFKETCHWDCTTLFSTISIWKDNFSGIPSVRLCLWVILWQCMTAAVLLIPFKFCGEIAKFRRPLWWNWNKKLQLCLYNPLRKSMIVLIWIYLCHYQAQIHVGVSERKNQEPHYNTKLKHIMMYVLVLTHLLDIRYIFQRVEYSQWNPICGEWQRSRLVFFSCKSCLKSAINRFSIKISKFVGLNLTDTIHRTIRSKWEI